MKIEKMPADIQSRVVAYLNYIQLTLEQQKELNTFFENISPALKSEVVNFIFSSAIKHNPIWKQQPAFQQILIYNIKMQMKQPEVTCVNQGELSTDFYIIARGECNIYVCYQEQQQVFIRTLYQGQYFGEVAILAESARTATVITRNYTTLGFVSKSYLLETLDRFPNLKAEIKLSLQLY